ncbi:MAG: Hpt domain-containing protein [Rubrivivax sp.]|jgi:hypothetical protein|nr:Hpt domain-containing protein [Rubrivivax sp.]
MNDPTSDPDAVLDAQSVAKLHRLDPDGRHGVVARVMAAFEASLVRAGSELIDACARGDAAAVAALGHTLKSSSASVGALDLSRRCAAAEAALRGGDTGRLQFHVDEMRRAADAALVAVRAMLRDGSAPR